MRIRGQRQIAAAVNRNLIPGLQVLGRDAGRTLGQRLARFFITGQCADLRQRQALHQGCEIKQGAFEGRVTGEHVVGYRHQRSTVTGFEGIEDAVEVAAVDHTEHLAHAGFFDAAAAMGNRLIEQGQGIAHAASCRAANQIEGLRLAGHLLGFKHTREVTGDQGRRQILEVELQAARQHRHRNLARVGGGQDEDHM